MTTTTERIQLNRKTAAQWTAANPVLLPGEAGVELDTGKVKFGNGTGAWTALPYSYAGAAGVTTVNARSGDVVVTKTDVGLGNVDNTADTAKPVSAAQAAALAAKVTAPTGGVDGQAIVKSGTGWSLATVGGGGTNGIFDVTGYGADRTGTTDSAAAVQAAITAAQTAVAVTGNAGGTAYKSPTVYFPPGLYKIGAPLTIDLSQTANAVADRHRLVLAGAGEGDTALKFTHTTGYGIDWLNGVATLRDLRLIGSGSTGGNSIMRLGRVDGSGVVSQFLFQQVTFHTSPDMLRMEYAYDGSFIRCGFFSAGNGSAVTVPLNGNNDNCNNISFYSTHFETLTSGSFLNLTGASTTALRPNLWTFYSCHFETRSSGAQLLTAAYIQRMKFHACQFSQNNATGSGFSPATAPAAFNLQNVTSIAFDDCSAGRSGEATGDLYTTSFFNLGGNINGLHLRGGFWDPGTLNTTGSKTALWKADATNAPVYPGTSPMTVHQVRVKNTADVAVTDESLYWTAAGDKRKHFAATVDDTNLALSFGYSNSQSALTPTERMVLQNDGLLAVSGLAGLTYTVADAAVQTFTFAANSNTNRRGVYFVYANHNGPAYAIVFSTGTALYPIGVGTAAAVGTTDPGTTSALSVYLSGTSIAVTNRLGAARAVTVLPMGFGYPGALGGS